MPLDFGRALAVSFPLSRYIPQENVHAVNTVTFSPQATFYRNRYGAVPSSVKGWPDTQLQHGQSTFWLGPLLAHPAFLAAHPEWVGVTVSEPLSVSDYTDLSFAASATLGGAYAWLRDQADMLGLLGSASGTGPVSSPGAPGVPGVAPVPMLVPSPFPVPAPPPVPFPGPVPPVSPLPSAPPVAVFPAAPVDYHKALGAAIEAFIANANPTPLESALVGPLSAYVKTGKVNLLAVALTLLALAQTES